MRQLAQLRDMAYNLQSRMKFIDLIKINLLRSPYQYHVLTKNCSLEFPLHNFLAMYLEFIEFWPIYWKIRK